MDTSTHRPKRSAEAVRLYLQREGGPVEVLLFDRPEITIGRASAREGSRPVLALADRGVSRRHAAILVGPERLVLEDRGGQAGVFVRGRRIRRRCVIAPGERFTFAGYTAWIERSEAPRSSSGGRGPAPQGGAAGRSSGGGADLSSAGLPEAPGDAGRHEARSRGTTEGATGPAEARARDWIRGGEPGGLLLRGRELRRALDWLREHPATPPGDPRRRWIERSDAMRSRRSRGRGLAGLAVATALGVGTLLSLRELPAAPLHPATATCKRAELAALHAWLDEDRGSLGRSALALGWADAMGCRSARIEGVAHRALARTPSERLGELSSADHSRIVAVGGGPEALLSGPKTTLYRASDGSLTAIGRPGSAWRISGDGRTAAEIRATGRTIELWALAGGPRSVAVLSFDEPIAAAALGEAGLELWIASGGRLRRWRRQPEGWIEGEGRGDGLGITAADRLSVGLGGVVVDRGGSLWWFPAGSKRAQRFGGGVDRWTLVDGGQSLVTATGGVVRRWRVHRRRLRGEVLAELAEPVLQLAPVVAPEGGADLALATTSELRLVDVHQRWRPRQALSRALVYAGAGREALSLMSDPEGRWLAAVDPSGATIWGLGDGAQLAPIAEFDWRSGAPEGSALVGDALVTSSKGRLERWPLVGAKAGLDGVAVELGEASRTLAIDPEGRHFAAGGGSTANVWTVTAEASRLALTTGLEIDEPVTAMTFADDGAWAVAHGDALDVHRLTPAGELITGASTSTVMGAPIERLAVADHGRWLVAADAGGELVSVPVAETSGRLRSWSLGAPATALAASPGGTQVLVGDLRGGLQTLRVGELSGPRQLPEHDGAVLAVAVSRGGAWLASSGEDRRLQLLTDTGDLRSSTVLPAAVDSLAFLGDGDWLAARDRQGRVSLHATRASLERTFGVRPGPAAGLLAGGPERLYVLAQNGAIELWDLRLTPGRARLVSVTEIAAGGESGARAWTIDPGGVRLLSADRVGTLRVRPLAVDALVETLCGLQPVGEPLGGPVPAGFAATLCRES